jgi:hypothetical protein
VSQNGIVNAFSVDLEDWMQSTIGPDEPITVAGGHEIASHGYGHELVYTITPERFRTDLERSIEIIERQAGRRPIGYRAPAFSVTQESLWAAPILFQLGVSDSRESVRHAGRAAIPVQVGLVRTAGVSVDDGAADGAQPADVRGRLFSAAALADPGDGDRPSEPRRASGRRIHAPVRNGRERVGRT